MFLPSQKSCCPVLKSFLTQKDIPWEVGIDNCRYLGMHPVFLARLNQGSKLATLVGPIWMWVQSTWSLRGWIACLVWSTPPLRQRGGLELKPLDQRLLIETWHFFLMGATRTGWQIDRVLCRERKGGLQGKRNANPRSLEIPSWKFTSVSNFSLSNLHFAISLHTITAARRVQESNRFHPKTEGPPR